MIQSLLVVGLPVLLAMFAGTAKATACNVTSPCPASAPCCSEFGFCGKGHFCLGGCNPFASRAFDSCKPNPICQDVTHTFADQSRILSNNTLFDGNTSAYDWVVESGNIVNSDGDLGLVLTEANGGTRLSTTRYVHYGTITARLKTGRWAGVITAFITMSDIKDEIDWEFPGAAVTEAQTNVFWQGVIPTGKTNGETHKGLTDTFANYHDYTIDWQPTSLTFLIDGKVVRTFNKDQTLDAAGVAHFPNTPSRVQISLWPAGIAGSAQGTVDWAGGMINWNDPDYKATGQFYARVKSVSIKCTNAQAVSATSNITSYIYGGDKASSNTPTVIYSNRTTLLNGAGRMVALQGGMGGLVVGMGLGLLLGVNALLL
ncbi:glycoside hydrolase family 16 protein [Crassisporium funariophilum]|nr:glycoside hydrolase family 16 protein [Crassisporium funariophilum]